MEESSRQTKPYRDRNGSDLASGLFIILPVALFYGGWSIGTFYAVSCHSSGHNTADDCHLLNTITFAFFAAAGLGALNFCIQLNRFIKKLFKKRIGESKNIFQSHAWLLAMGLIAFCISSYFEIDYEVFCIYGSHSSHCDMLHFIKQFGAVGGIIFIGGASTRFAHAMRCLAEAGVKD